jgi:hypothetical protein
MPLSDPVVSGYLVTLGDLTLAWASASLPFPITDPPPIITPEFPNGTPPEPCIYPYPTSGQAWPLLVTTPTETSTTT